MKGTNMVTRKVGSSILVLRKMKVCFFVLFVVVMTMGGIV